MVRIVHSVDNFNSMNHNFENKAERTLSAFSLNDIKLEPKDE